MNTIALIDSNAPAVRLERGEVVAELSFLSIPPFNPSREYHGLIMRFKLLLALLLLCAAALQPQGNRPLAGVIDVHVHSLPDSEPWAMDGIEVAKLSKASGMRGLVLKSH